MAGNCCRNRTSGEDTGSAAKRVPVSGRNRNVRYPVFLGDETGSEAAWIGGRNEASYSLTEKRGVFRLYCGKQTIGEKGCSSYFGLRQKSYHFHAAVRFRFEPQSEDETAGMVLYQNHENHLRMEIGKKGADVCFRVSTYVHAREEVIREVLLKEEQELWEILIRGEEQSAGIWVRLGEKMICACDKVSLLAYTTEEAGGFVGCTIGMYASSHGTDSKNYADYVSFTCSGAEE